MTLEGCLIFDPYIYLAHRKCRDLADVIQGRFSAGVMAGISRLLSSWLQVQTLYYVPLTLV